MTNTAKNMTSRGIVLGVGLLSAGSLIGISQPASAQSRAEVREERRDVKQARKEVRQERRDVAKADTRSERREEKQELRDAKQELRRERRDVRQERWENSGRWNNGRYNEPQRDVNGDGVYDHKDAYIIGQRREQRGAFNRRYNYNRNSVVTRNGYRTEEGIVVDDLSGNAFLLRTIDGQQLRVQVPGGEPNRISRGDRVRVYGFFNNGAFRAQSLTILRNR
ncbi:MAG TPA: hypothetical protein VF600_04750 [Abditibacteriaceae bacterium]